MPDLFAVTKRAQEIIAERFDRWHEDLQQQGQDAYQAPQADKRRAFAEVQQASMADYPAARAAFEEQYGPEEWRRQSALQQRREQKEADGG